MGWLRVDLRGTRDPLAHDCGAPRGRRLALRRRLLTDLELTGAAALAIASEVRVLELREAAEQAAASLQDLQ